MFETLTNASSPNTTHYSFTVIYKEKTTRTNITPILCVRHEIEKRNCNNERNISTTVHVVEEKSKRILAQNL
jgi:hypothetical protein